MNFEWKINKKKFSSQNNYFLIFHCICFNLKDFFPLCFFRCKYRQSRQEISNDVPDVFLPSFTTFQHNRIRCRVTSLYPTNCLNTNTNTNRKVPVCWTCEKIRGRFMEHMFVRMIEAETIMIRVRLRVRIEWPWPLCHSPPSENWRISSFLPQCITPIFQTYSWPIVSHVS